MEVVFDYYSTTLYPSQYEKTVKNGGYVKMPYLHGKGDSQPNLVYQTRKYKTEQLMITKASSPKYDGELVIKHKPITNGDTSVYLVIPLKTRPTIYEESAIDKIINNIYDSPYDFHLGELIGYNQSCKVSKDETLFVLSPLFVKSSFDSFSKSEFKMGMGEGEPEDFRKIKAVFAFDETDKVVEGLTVKEDGGDDGYVMYDCEAVIENDGKPKQTVEMMPVTSDLARQMGTMNVLTATIHFFIFLFMIVIATLGTPFLYKNLFIDYIKRLNISTSPMINAASLKMFDYIGTVLLLIFSMGISISGMSVGDPIQTSIGGLMSIFIIISITVITYYKSLDPNTYSFGITNVDIVNGIMFFSKIFEKLVFNIKNAGLLYAVIIGISLITYLVGKFDKDKKKDKSKRDFMLTYAFIFGLIVSVYVATRMS